MRKRPFVSLLDACLILGALSLAFSLSLRRISDYDMWFHLKIGQYILQTGHILKTYYYNCSWPNFPFLDHEWLFQVITYGIYKPFGETGLVVLQVSLVVAAFFILFRILKLYTDSSFLIAIVLCLGIVASAHRFALRPNHFSYIFLLFMLFSLHQFKHGRIRYVYLLPPIMLLWVNIHAESLWGIVVPGVFATAEWAKQAKQAKHLFGKGSGKKALKHLTVAYLLVILVSLVNPFTYKTVIWPLKVMSEQFGGVEELLPPITAMYLPFWIYFGVFVLTSILSIRRIDMTWLSLSIIFAVIAWTANRGIPHFVFISAPLIAMNLMNIKDFIVKRFDWLERLIRFSFIPRIILLILIILLIRSIVSGPGYLKKFDNIPYPEDAITFMQNNGITGNIFDNHGWGGYLIWKYYPEVRPYIDGRFFHKRFFDEYNLILSGIGWKELLAKYNISLVLLPYSTGQEKNLRDYLFNDPDWSLIYWDDTSLLYARDTEKNAGVINVYSTRMINPDTDRYNPSNLSPAGLEKAINEVRNNLVSAPNSWKAHAIMGSLLYQKGDFHKAIDEYKKAIRISNGGIGGLYYSLALCYQSAGDVDKEESALRKAVKLMPDNEDVRLTLGRLLLLKGRYKEAEPYIKR